MKLFKIFLSLFIILALFVSISRFFPSYYHVDRQIEINKPVNDVYMFMSDLRNWEKWSLWNKDTDSTLRIFYGKRSDSIGGRQYFEGDILGEGRFLIHLAEPNKTVGYNLYMHQGNVNASGLFTMESTANNNTVLHWIDSGDVGDNPIFRYMMTTKVKSTAKSFDEGLSRIKIAVEK
jgi:hypothetical protein